MGFSANLQVPQSPWTVGARHIRFSNVSVPWSPKMAFRHLSILLADRKDSRRSQNSLCSFEPAFAPSENGYTWTTSVHSDVLVIRHRFLSLVLHYTLLITHGIRKIYIIGRTFCTIPAERFASVLGVAGVDCSIELPASDGMPMTTSSGCRGIDR